MPAIFISHRKEDTPGTAAHLYKNLSESFGPQAVFMNVAASQPGRDVRQVIDEHLAGSAVMLVVIGKAWADAQDESGQRRLDSPLDLVRIETAAALRRKLPVIPVLVQGAVMVQPAELPPDLADLAFRNPVTLLQSQWGSDVETLVTLLKSLVQGQGADASATAETEPPRDDPSPPAAAPPVRVVRPQPVGKLPWRSMLAAMVVVVVMALGVYAFMASRHAPADKAVAQAQQAALAVPKAEATPAEPARAEAARATASAAQTQSAKDQAQRDAAREQAQKADEAAKAATAEKSKVELSAAPAAAAAAASAAVSGVVRGAASAVARDAASRASGSETPQAPLAAAPAAKPPPAAASVAMKPALPTTASAAAKVLSFQKWTLNSGGCGAGPLTVTGTARFSIEKTSDAIVVTEEFRGSGGGFDVVVTGQVEFSHEQPSYDIPTSGEWSGAKVFKTTGLDRVTTSDGLTPRSANVVKLQSLCG